jgi:uncharacterized protein involved in exopolysaccharide biosynthesis
MGALLTRSLWNERRFLLEITLGSLLYSTLIAMVLPERYESEARFITPGVMDSSALYIGLLQSRTVQDRLIERFDLRKIYGDRLWEDARKDLEKHSEIAADRKNGIITIRAWDGDPERAALLVQGRMEELNLFIQRMDASSAHSERVFLEARLVKARQDLESAQNDLSKYASDNLIGDMDGQERVITNTLGKDEGKLTVDQEEFVGQDSIYADEGAQDRATQSRTESQDSSILNFASGIQRKLTADQAALAGLKESYTAANIQVRASQAGVAQLQRELAKLVGKSNPPTPAKQFPRSLLPSLRQIPAVEAGYADALRPAAVEEAVFDALTQENERAKMAEVRNTGTIRVLDPPSMSENKSWPFRLWVIFLITISFFSLAVAWIFGTMRWQRWPEDPQKMFAIEAFQTVGTYFHVGTKKRSICHEDIKVPTYGHLE